MIIDSSGNSFPSKSVVTSRRQGRTFCCLRNFCVQIFKCKRIVHHKGRHYRFKNLLSSKLKKSVKYITNRSLFFCLLHNMHILICEKENRK